MDFVAIRNFRPGGYWCHDTITSVLTAKPSLNYARPSVRRAKAYALSAPERVRGYSTPCRSFIKAQDFTPPTTVVPNGRRKMDQRKHQRASLVPAMTLPVAVLQALKTPSLLPLRLRPAVRIARVSPLGNLPASQKLPANGSHRLTAVVDLFFWKPDRWKSRPLRTQFRTGPARLTVFK